MLLNFLHEDGILFLPIETVCSKLIFPPAPEAERNRQCGPAGWTQRLSLGSPTLRLVVRFGHVFLTTPKGLSTLHPYLRVIASIVALLCGLVFN